MELESKEYRYLQILFLLFGISELYNQKLPFMLWLGITLIVMTIARLREQESGGDMFCFS